MRKLSRHRSMPVPARTATLLLSALAALGPVVAGAGEVNWDQIEGKTITTFYPGVASWDFVRGQDHGSGATVVRKMTKSCADCHVGKSGEFDINADGIVSGGLKMSDSGKPFEPSPIAGAQGFKNVEVKAAYDERNVYVRFQWEGTPPGSSAPAKISVQINDNIRSFANFGCFIACHDDQAGMPGGGGSETKLYGYYTRDGANVRPQAKLDEHLSKGQFIDLWIASAAGAGVKATDQYVLQDRLDDRNDLTAAGGYAGGKYTVVLTRALNTGDGKDVAIAEGKAITIGVAIHESGNEGRKHYVSFPVSVGLSAPASIAARKLPGGGS